MNYQDKSSDFLTKRLLRLQARISGLFPLMRGSIVRIGMKTKRPTYSLNMNGKTKIIALGNGKDQIAAQRIENYRKLLTIVDEMTLINIELIRRMEAPKGKNA